MICSGAGFEAEGPDPLPAALDGRQRNVADVGERAVGRIGPGNDVLEVAHDLPLRKQGLNLRRVFERERLENEARGLARGSHGEMIATTSGQ